MLKSRNRINRDIAAYLDAYDGLRFSKAPGVLSSREPARHGDINQLRPDIHGLVERGAEIMSRPDFNNKDVVSDEERHDVAAVAEEMASAHDELLAMTDPEVVFKSLPHSHKMAAVEGHRADRVKVDRLLARISGELRKQTAVPDTTQDPIVVPPPKKTK